MIWLEIGLGFLAGAFAVWGIHQIFGPKEVSFWRNGLIAAAIIYVLFAMIGGAWSAMPLELGGLALFTAIAWLSRRYSIYLLAMGWALHIAWDQILHPGGHSGFIPEWYPGVCLGFDVAIALYILYLSQKQDLQKTNL